MGGPGLGVAAGGILWRMDQIRDRWGSIAPVLSQLRRLQEFSLGAPCVVIDQSGSTTVTTLSDLSRVLRASLALASEEMSAYLERAAVVGGSRAWEEIANDDEKGQGFCAQWDQVQEDIRRGCRVSIDEVVGAVMTARTGFESSPRSLLVVVCGEKTTDITLVS